MSTLSSYLRRSHGVIQAELRATNPLDGALAVFILAYGTSLFIWLTFSAYFGVSTLTSISFWAEDGWCELSSQGLGLHCFGDFRYPVSIALQDNPWSNYIPYPAASLLPYALLGNLDAILGTERFALALYLLLSAIALAIPALWSISKIGLFRGAVTFVALGPLSIPAINALDRGNLVVFIVPAILMLLVGVHGNKKSLIVFAIILAAIVKPQFLILLVIPVAMRWWRTAVTAFVGVVLIHLLAFLWWPKALLKSIPDSLAMLLSFGGYDSVASHFPSQISFARGVYELVDWSIGPSGLNWVAWTDARVDLVQSYAGTVFVGFVVALLATLGKRIPGEVVAIVGVALAAMYSGTTYSYYAVFALPVGVWLLTKLARHSGAYKERACLTFGSNDASTRRLTVLVMIGLSAVLVTVTRLPVPVAVGEGVVATSSFLAPIAWAMAIVSAIVLSLYWRNPKAAG